MGGGGWIESVAEARRRARRRLPAPVYDALLAGAERGGTLADNEAAFAELGLLPRIAAGPTGPPAIATTVLGERLELPVLISPAGVQALDPEGELPLARAAAAAGTAIGLSSFAGKPVEEVVAANPSTFFQAYWLGGRERVAALLERVRAAGVRGLIVTLDWSFAHRRDWGSPRIPERLDWRAALALAPRALARPRWLASFLRAGGPPALTVPNLAPPGGSAPSFFAAYGEWMATPRPSWDEVAWMRSEWGGPFLVKGVMRVEDARRALAAGADAISVSNHGGNNLDGTPASIRALPAIADAVGGQAEVLLDGGVRRGSDVVKALALGARAVLAGRAPLWGLAAGGEAGVGNVLSILRDGVAETLTALGRRSVEELERGDVLVPPGFERP